MPSTPPTNGFLSDNDNADGHPAALTTTSLPSDGDRSILNEKQSSKTTMDSDKANFTFDNMPISSSSIRNRQSAAQALSMSFMKSLSGICCQECGNDPIGLATSGKSKVVKEDTNTNNDKKDDDVGHTPSELYNLQVLQHPPSSATTTRQQNNNVTTATTTTTTRSSSISPLVMAPMNGKMSQQQQQQQINYQDMNTVEGLLGEYMCLCQFYQVPYNAGIVTTLRFSLPSLRVSGSFHDMDMMALVELLLRHGNDRMSYIHRLDFTVASKEGKQWPKTTKVGFTSHGALALAKVLQSTKYIRQVWVPRHRIGPYGASALFIACRDNDTIQQLNLRRCRIGERGALAFCELIFGNDTIIHNTSTNTTTTTTATTTTHGHGLLEVDLSSNGIGHRGTRAIEDAMNKWNAISTSPLFVNVEGNLVFPEIMNGVTHGLGVVLSLIGGYLLSNRVQHQSMVHTISTSVYTTSLLVLYLSSTLYHSFFSLQHTKYIFQVMDKCAIYVLIAGSYTPFLTIMFSDKPMYSIGLLGFIWTCCFLGISVEAFVPNWKYRPIFSLSMYLGMGWASMVCLPETGERLPIQCIHLLILGGVGYTAGVPFFIRDNNLDHAIWHLFVMSGSIFHWFGVYLYVAPTPLSYPK